MKCAKCGRENRAEAIYCRFCGEEIVQAVQTEQTAQSAPSAQAEAQPQVEASQSAQATVPEQPQTVPEDDFIGHETIRNELNRYIKNRYTEKMREDLGGKQELTNHIILFSGNTGTGKYTLAQWFASKLKERKLIEGKIKEFYAKELKNQFEDEYAIKSFLDQNNFGVLIIRDIHFDTEYLNDLLRALSLNKSGTVCICLGLKNKLEEYFKENPDNKQRINDFYELKDYTDITLCEILEEKLKEKKLTYDAAASDCLLQFVIEENNKEDKAHENGWLVERDIIPEIMEAQSERISKIENPAKEDYFTILSEDIPAKYVRRTEEEIFAELNSLIGLTKLKEEIKELMESVKATKARIEKGLGGQIPELHIELLGNPGTGKTTVARMLGELFNAIGLLPSHKVIEVDRSNLIAGYQSQTATLLSKYCDKAMGGILFIDEAYDLKNGEQDSYGQEAINTLLKRMEDDRGKFIVIAAGYKKEMEIFNHTNSGLESRFEKKIVLPDYNEAELIQIFKLYTKKKDYILTADAEKVLEKVIKQIYATRGETFANARTIRNLFNATIRRQSSRVMKLSAEEQTREAYMEIRAEDIQNNEEEAE